MHHKVGCFQKNLVRLISSPAILISNNIATSNLHPTFHNVSIPSELPTSNLAALPFFSRETCPSPVTKIHIDTYKHIQRLQQHSAFNKEQSEVMIDAMKSMFTKEKIHQHENSPDSPVKASTTPIKQPKMLTSLVQFEAFQRVTHLDLIRELSMNSINSKSMREELNQRIVHLNEKCRQDLAKLRLDCQAMISTYKDENRENEQKIDLKLHTIRGYFTVTSGTYKANTEIAKLKAITLFSGK